MNIHHDTSGKLRSVEVNFSSICLLSGSQICLQLYFCRMPDYGFVELIEAFLQVSQRGILLLPFYLVPDIRVLCFFYKSKLQYIWTSPVSIYCLPHMHLSLQPNTGVLFQTHWDVGKNTSNPSILFCFLMLTIILIWESHFMGLYQYKFFDILYGGVFPEKLFPFIQVIHCLNKT
jgi:hypothetical protein